MIMIPRGRHPASRSKSHVCFVVYGGFYRCVSRVFLVTSMWVLVAVLGVHS